MHMYVNFNVRELSRISRKHTDYRLHIISHRQTNALL